MHGMTQKLNEYHTYMLGINKNFAGQGIRGTSDDVHNMLLPAVLQNDNAALFRHVVCHDMTNVFDDVFTGTYF